MSTRSRVLAVLAAVVAIGLGVATVVRVTREALPRTDFFVYMTGANAVLRGGTEMYTATDIHGWHYTMPPLFAICAVPLALLPTGVAVALWYAISIALLVVSVGAIARLVTPAGERPRLAVVVAPLLLCADPLCDTLTRSQMGIAMLAPCVLALRADARGRPFLAGLLVALASTLKVYAGLLVLWFVARRQWRALRGCAMGFVLFGAIVPAFALGPRLAATLWWTWFRGIVLPYAQQFGEPLPFAELQNHMIAKNMSLYATAAHMAAMLRGGELGAAETWVKAVAALAGLALVVAAWRAWRRLPVSPPQYAQLFAWSLAMMLGLLLVPTAWSHYFVLLLLPVAAAVGYALHGHDAALRRFVRRSLVAFAVLFFGYTLTSIVRPMVDKDRALLELVMVPRSAGLFCWATLVLGAAFLHVLRRDRDSATAGGV